MDAPGPAELSDAEVGARLREAGLRVTRSRLAAYSVLRKLGGHRSVDELVGALRARGERLPRMTVYNAVSALRSAGLVMGADAGPGRALYEARELWHHHFVCRRCGRVVDVPCVVGERSCLDAALEGVEVDEAQVIFRGLCTRCRGTRGAPRRP